MGMQHPVGLVAPIPEALAVLHEANAIDHALPCWLLVPSLNLFPDSRRSEPDSASTPSGPFDHLNRIKLARERSPDDQSKS
jgi:hypothetical protein